MANKVEDISKMIADAKNAIKINDENRKQEKTDDINNKKKEFDRIYKENLEKLKATGIVEIFEDIIKKEVVLLKPAHDITNTIKKRACFGRIIETEVVQRIPKELAYITWSSGTPLMSGSDYIFDHNEAVVYLNFDLHFRENPHSDNGSGTYEPETVPAICSNGEFRLGHGDNISGISRDDLIEKVGEYIIAVKGLTLPKTRK